MPLLPVKAVRATSSGFEADSTNPQDLDLRAYARTRERAVRLVAQTLDARRPRTRKATPLALGEEVAAPATPRGRKLCHW
jgi:hypothetical protein